MERVDVVETDDTKNNRPFRLQNKIMKIEVFSYNIYLLPDGSLFWAREELQINSRKITAKIILNSILYVITTWS